ncbi:MAG: hypothetical protein K2G11_06405, partial [Muribaculaceae bacterium]|nr:hypothetical protein [Muribaculaceae bacterium]
MKKIYPLLLILIVGAVVHTGCSTTKRLGPGEVLYTGVKKIQINPTDKEKLPSELVGNIKETLAVDPACPLPFVSPYVANPFPFGLW